MQGGRCCAAETQEEAGQPGRIIHGTLRGVADPAFLDTARLALEAGICLAKQVQYCPTILT